jgi:hypothetical protein
MCHAEIHCDVYVQQLGLVMTCQLLLQNTSEPATRCAVAMEHVNSFELFTALEVSQC